MGLLMLPTATKIQTIPLGQFFSPIVYDRDKFRNREQSETNRYMMKMQCETVYPNTYECVSDILRFIMTVSEHLRTLCERDRIAEDLIRYNENSFQK